MLQSIYVKNFILFDEVVMDFNDGMSTFTGETGAGKSLLIDAIASLLGGRVRGDMVKKGSDKAIVEATFDISKNSKVNHLLKDAGYDIVDDVLLITREFNLEGKNTMRINRRPTTVSFVKELANYLVDIHSQHDTQYLLNAKYHLHLLDQYVNEAKLHEEVKVAYDHYQKIKKSLNETLDGQYNEDDLEFLKFQLQEIEDANLDEIEVDNLEAELKHLQSFEKISTHLHQAIEYMDGSDSAKDLIYEGSKELEALHEFENIKVIGDQIYDLYYNLDEKVERLRDILNSLEYDEARVNDIQERLFEVNKIKRKYGGSFLYVIQKSEEIKQKIDQIEHRQEFIEREEKKLQEAQNLYLKLAKKLSTIRKTKAKELISLIVNELKGLQLLHARFDVRFREIENKDGIDQVEFLISMNAGEALKPLSSTASGGELSRFMLGLKTIFTSLQGIDTVIFDEIDTGVSGSVALAIGKKMAKLSTSCQVFCVTHLAQVAACAKQQYLVEKNQEFEKTSTSILLLDVDQRLEELAFIANGSKSSSAIEAAKELFKRAQEQEEGS